MAKSSLSKSTLRLPVQVLNWGAIGKKNIGKMFFQAEVSVSGGRKKFDLVAYTAKKKGGKWDVETKKIIMPRQTGKKLVEIPLPVTLGNVELKKSDIAKLVQHGGTQFIFTPKLFKKNPHVSYDISTDGFTTLATANPSPPADPS